jgi:hypothetical protein
MFKRISASRPINTAIDAFAGGTQNTTILSSSYHTLLSFFDTKTILPFRAVCKDTKNAVQNHNWHDEKTVVSNIINWNICFPRASAIFIAKLKINDNDFELLRDINTLIILYNCNITGEGFVHLENLQTLKIYNCNSIDDSSFKHLKNIRNISINNCFGITGDGFSYLKNIKTFEIVINRVPKSMQKKILKLLKYTSEIKIIQTNFI